MMFSDEEDFNDRKSNGCYLSTGVVKAYFVGEHGVREVALSVPSEVRTSGVQQRIRERWNQDEYRVFLFLNILNQIFVFQQWYEEYIGNN